MASITPGAANPIRTDLAFTPIAPGASPVPPWYGAYMPVTNRPVYDWYDSGSTAGTNNPAAHSQRIVRDNEFHNVEINLFSFALGGGARQGYHVQRAAEVMVFVIAMVVILVMADIAMAVNAAIAAENVAMARVVPLRTAPRDSLVHVHLGTVHNAASCV